MGDLHNEIKYLTGPMRAVRLGLGLGEGDGLVRVDESLTVVSDWFARSDWAILAGDNLGWGSVSLSAGGAGIRSMVALVNPASSGRVYITDYFESDDTTAVIKVLAPAPVAGVGGWAAVTEQGTRDTRASLPARLLSNITVAGVGSTRWRFHGPGRIQLQVVVGPNTAIIFDPAADNATFQGSISWRERLLLPGEPPSNR